MTCLNWTKVGLKDGEGQKHAKYYFCLNWTKVGLKAFRRNRDIAELIRFELD